MRRILGGVAAFVVAMTFTTTAHAAVVSAVDDDWMSTLDYNAAPGESNSVDVTYTLDPGGYYVVTIEDRGATITTTTPVGVTGTGCTPTSLHRAVCRYARNSAHSANFRLGDGNDTFIPHGAAEQFSIYGGAGDDRLVGGTDYNWFEPGAGTDQVIGGPGFDTVSYDDHTTPVSITIDGQANDGAPGENDSLVGIEDYAGGSGDDTLIGSDGPDRLEGGPGADVIDGRSGDDILGGDAGADHVIGGAGQDSISPGLGGLVEAVDGEADQIYCGGRANDLRTDSQDVLDECPS